MEIKRTALEGRNLERTFSALAFLLSAWCTGSEERRSSGMSAISFDKLASVLLRMWNRLYSSSTRALPPEDEQSECVEDQITFVVPMVQMPGIHGPGPARWDGASRPKYVIEMLDELRREGIEYVEIRIPRKAHGVPTYRGTYVLPSTVVGKRGEELPGFTRRERVVLSELGGALKHLTDREIRVLGIHGDARGTAAAIIYEMHCIARLLRPLIDAIVHNKSFQREAQSMLVYASEAVAKSKDNRASYESARQKMLAEIRDVRVREAFMAEWCDPHSIWDSPEIASLYSDSKWLRELACYFRALAYFRGTAIPKMAVKHRIGERWLVIGERALGCLQNQGIEWVPRTFWDAFEGESNKLSSVVQNQIWQELERIARELLP